MELEFLADLERIVAPDGMVPIVCAHEREGRNSVAVGSSRLPSCARGRRRVHGLCCLPSGSRLLREIGLVQLRLPL